MKALVIFYEGVIPNRHEVNKVIDSASFITGKASFVPFEEDKIAGIVVKSCNAPKITVEDGDNSVVVLAGMCDMGSFQFGIDIMKHLNDPSIHQTESGTAFLKACSLLAKTAKEVPVSRETADKYGFTVKHRECVRNLYKAYIRDYE